MQPLKEISHSLADNEQYLNELLGIGKTFDVIAKEYHFSDTRATLYAVNGFFATNTNIMLIRDVAAKIVEYLKHQEKLEQNNLVQFINTHLPFVQVSIVEDMDNAILQMLSGPMVLLIDGYAIAIAIDSRVYPQRNTGEPETERVIRGPRDGYTETLLTNTALTRRRIRDPKLRFEIMQIGKRSKTDVCIGYIEDITNPDLVENIRTKLKSIDTDGLPMAEQSLEEYLVGGSWNPYPLVRYTERPDVASVHLLQGHALIFVDTSPEVIIAPTTFFHHLHHPEDYHQRPLVGTYMRWAILLAMLMAMFLPALWLDAALYSHRLPSWLAFFKPKDTKSSLPLAIQLLIAEVGIEVFRRAVVNAPIPVANAIGLVAGLVFGQFSVLIGLVNADVLVYSALATLGSFATSSPELDAANRITRIGLICLVGLFHIFGLIVGVILLFVLLARTKTFGIPYLWPLFPFSLNGIVDFLIREPVSKELKRPFILRPKDDTKK